MVEGGWRRLGFVTFCIQKNTVIVGDDGNTICDLGNVSSSQVSPSESSDGEQAKSKKAGASSSSPNNPFQARRARTVFTEKQLHELETTFQRHKYLSVQERQLLAHRMALSDIQVKTWYQNRRFDRP